MRKNAKKRNNNQGRHVPAQRTLRLAEVVRQNLYAFVIREGMKALDEVLEQDREWICGPLHAKGPLGQPVRWGHSDGRLVMGGQRVVVRRPRVRKQSKEVMLPAWAQFADEDPLQERTLQQMLLGVSTRGYRRSIEPVPEELQPHGTSKSAASRRFVSMTEDRLAEWLQRDLSEMRLAVIMIDGIVVEEQTVLAALGIDAGGTKHPLGLWLGATEHSTVCGALLDNLIERGLNAQCAYLFVIDGSKALRKAIRERFGERALVQRCQQHKRRNVLSHLPKRLHPSVSKSILDAYRSQSKATAKKRLLQLASQLDDEYPDAVASLKEGLDETLTLKDLGLPPNLERTLSSTNPIENLNTAIRRITRRVKRWRGGKMVKRWVAAALFEAQRGFRRLRGYKGMSILLHALGTHAEQIDRLDDQREVA